MSIDRIVFAFAGAIVMLSVVLGYLVSPYWLLLAGFAMILRKFGVAPGCAFG